MLWSEEKNPLMTFSQSRKESMLSFLFASEQIEIKGVELYIQKGAGKNKG